MKKRLAFVLVAALLWSLPPVGLAHAQDYDIPWWTLDNGGGTSTNGDYVLGGSIGQPDTGVMDHGDYAVAGGFWGGSATAEDYEITWWTHDNGGGISTNGNYVLNGTIGQPDTGVMQSGTYALAGGFWKSGSTITDPFYIYLPTISRVGG